MNLTSLKPRPNSRASSESTPSDEALLCRGLCKSFGGVLAVDDVTLSFEAGKVTALIGPNGAGKTTLFHILAGSLKADSGDILYKGSNLNGLQPWERARLGIGRLFQDVRVFGRLTVLENVLVGFPRRRASNPLATWYAHMSLKREEHEDEREAMRLLGLVGLESQAQEPADALSFGQQKLLAIARLLAGQPQTLLLDEPAAGVNPSILTTILDLLRALATEGRTIVLIEHDMEVVLRAADWVFFMAEGRIEAFGLPQEVISDPSIRLRFLGR